MLSSGRLLLLLAGLLQVLAEPQRADRRGFREKIRHSRQHR